MYSVGSHSEQVEQFSVCIVKRNMSGTHILMHVTDTTPPEPGTVVVAENYGKQHANFHNNARTVWCWWYGFREDVSQIVAYDMEIFEEGTKILAYQRTPCGNVSSAVAGNLNLIDNQAYIVRVYAMNSAGLETYADSSFILSTAFPVVENVLDMSFYPLSDIDYVSERTVNVFSQFLAYDTVSGIKSLQMAVSLATPTAFDVLYPREIGLLHPSIPIDVSAYNGMKLFVAITAVNHAGLKSTAFSDGFIVDLEPPKCRVGTCVFALLSGSPRSVKITGASLQCRYSPLIVDMETSIEAVMLRGVCRGGNFSCTEWIQATTLSYVMSLPPLQYDEGQSCYCEASVTDKVGHSQIFVSDQVSMDMTPPLQGMVDITDEWIVSYQQAVSISYFGFEDAESSQIFFEVGIGHNLQDPDGVLNFQQIPNNGFALIYGAEFRSGENYTACLRATNMAGLFTIVCSKAFRFDSTLPTASGRVEQGIYFNGVLYQTTCKEIAISYSCSDLESGVSSAEIMLGSSNTFLEGWTPVSPAGRFTFKNLSLSEGSAYTVSLRCTNMALLSKVLVLPYIVCINPSAPTAASLPNDGDMEGIDVDFQNNASKFSGSWSFVGQIPLQNYSVGLSSKNCSEQSEPDILGFRSVLSATKISVDLEKVALLHKRKYFLFVKASNIFGLTTLACSDGFMLSLSPPSCPLVMDGSAAVDTDFARDSLYVSVQWKCTGPVALAAVVWEVMDGRSNQVVASRVLDGSVQKAVALLNTVDGLHYISCITARDLAGNSVRNCSDGWRVDSSPPVLRDVSVTSSTSAGFSKNTTHISAVWKCDDVESGASSTWRLVTSPFFHEVTAFQHSRETLLVHAQATLASGKGYHMEVACVNGAGDSVSKYSELFVIDNTAPSCGKPVLSCEYPEGFAQQQSFPHSIAGCSCIVKFPQETMADLDSGIAAVEVAIHSSENNTLMRKTYDGSPNYLSMDGLTLVNNTRYFASLQCQNRAGLSSRAQSEPIVVTLGSLVVGRVMDGAQSDRIEMDFSTHPKAMVMSFSGFHHQAIQTLRYAWSIGSSAGASDVMAMTWIDANKMGNMDVYHYGIQFLQGAKYFSTVKAVARWPLQVGCSCISPENTSQCCDPSLPKWRLLFCSESALDSECDAAAPIVQAANASSDGFIYTDSPPSISQLGMGIAGEQDFVLLNGPTCNWNASDTLVGLHYAHIKFGSYPGGDDVLGYVLVNLTSNSTQTSYQHKGTTILPGVKVWATVQITNRAGLSSTRIGLKGAVHDVTPPSFNATDTVLLEVMLADVGAKISICNNTKNTSLNFLLIITWPAFHDDASGIQSLTVCYQNIGLRSVDSGLQQCTSGVDPKERTMRFAIQAAGLSKYMATVAAANKVGLVTTVFSAPVLVGPACPDCADTGINVVASYALGLNGTWLTILTVKWKQCYLEDCGGGLTYQIAVGTSGNSTSFLDLGYPIEPSGNVSSLQAVLQGLYIPAGLQVVLAIKVSSSCNFASTQFYSQPVLVDWTPPVIGSINISSNEFGILSARHTINASWEQPYDNESGLADCWYGFCTFEEKGLSCPANFSQLPAKASGVLLQDLELELGKQYSIVVRCRNKAGLVSEKQSNPVMYAQAPVVGDILHGEHCEREAMVQDLKTISACWPSISERGTAIKSIEWCLGSTPQQADIMACTNVGVARMAVARLATSLTTSYLNQYHVIVNVYSWGTPAASGVSAAVLVDREDPQPGHMILGDLSAQGSSFAFCPDSRVAAQSEECCLITDNCIAVTWDGFNDNFGIVSYTIGLSGNQGSLVLLQQDVGLESTHTLCYDFMEGRRYTVFVKAFDQAGRHANATQEIIFTFALSKVVDIILDQQAVGGSAQLLSGRFDVVGRNRVKALQWRVCAEEHDDACSSAHFVPLPVNATSIQSPIQLFSLKHGELYVVEIQAEDIINGQKDSFRSPNAFIYDENPPFLGHLQLFSKLVVNGGEMAIANAHTCGNQLDVHIESWFADYETGIVESYICLGSRLGAEDLMVCTELARLPSCMNQIEAWEDAGSCFHLNVDENACKKATHISAMYVAFNGVGNRGQAFSNILAVDRTSPNATEILLNTGEDLCRACQANAFYISQASSIQARWDVPYDFESGICGCTFAVVQSGQVRTIQSLGERDIWKQVPCDAGVDGVNLVDRKLQTYVPYKMALQVTNCAGSSKISLSEGSFTLDEEPPLPANNLSIFCGDVQLGSATIKRLGTDTLFLHACANSNNLTFTWPEFREESGSAVDYSFGVLENALVDMQDDPAVLLASTGTDTRAFSKALVPGSSYVAHICGKDSAGNSLCTQYGPFIIGASPVLLKDISIIEVQAVTRSEWDILVSWETSTPKVTPDIQYQICVDSGDLSQLSNSCTTVEGLFHTRTRVALISLHEGNQPNSLQRPAAIPLHIVVFAAASSSSQNLSSKVIFLDTTAPSIGSIQVMQCGELGVCSDAPTCNSSACKTVVLQGSHSVMQAYVSALQDQESGLMQTFRWRVVSAQGKYASKWNVQSTNLGVISAVGLELQHEEVYQFEIAVSNTQGMTTVQKSQGIVTVSNTLQRGYVSDGEILEDTDWSAKQNEARCSWNSSSFGSILAILNFKVSLKSFPPVRCYQTLQHDDGMITLKSTVANSTETTVLFTGLDLQHSSTYFCEVETCAQSGHCVTSESDGFVVDLGKPHIGCVEEERCRLLTCNAQQPLFLSIQPTNSVNLTWASAIEAKDIDAVKDECPSAYERSSSQNFSDYDNNLGQGLLTGTKNVAASEIPEHVAPVQMYSYAFESYDESAPSSSTFQPFPHLNNIKSPSSQCCKTDYPWINSDFTVTFPNNLGESHTLCSFGPGFVAVITQQNIAFLQMATAEVLSIHPLPAGSRQKCSSNHNYLSIHSDRELHVYTVNPEPKPNIIRFLGNMLTDRLRTGCTTVLSDGSLLMFDLALHTLSKYTVNRDSGWDLDFQIYHHADMPQCVLQSFGNLVVIASSQAAQVYALVVVNKQVKDSAVITARPACDTCSSLVSRHKGSAMLTLITQSNVTSANHNQQDVHKLRCFTLKESPAGMSYKLNISEVCKTADFMQGSNVLAFSTGASSNQIHAAVSTSESLYVWGIEEATGKCKLQFAVNESRGTLNDQHTSVAVIGNIIVDLLRNGRGLSVTTSCTAVQRKILPLGGILYDCEACKASEKAAPGVMNRCEQCAGAICLPAQIQLQSGALFIPDMQVQSNTVYHSIVKATTATGSTAQSASHAMVFDGTPPVAGSVLDVVIFDAHINSSNSSFTGTDVTYLARPGILAVEWLNFYDAESDIAMYHAAVGSAPLKNDISGWMSSSASSNRLVFSDVKTTNNTWYYVTVEACNNAHPTLCTMVSSDGVIVDTTQPRMLYVMDGLQPGHDIDEQTYQDSVFGSWKAEDPESGAPEYEWAYTTDGNVLNNSALADTLPFEWCGSSEYFGKTGTNTGLSEGKRLYVCARAINKAGIKSSVMCSDGIKLGKMEKVLSDEEEATLAFSMKTLQTKTATQQAQPGEGVLFASVILPPGAAEEGARFVVGQLQQDEYDGKYLEHPADSNTSHVPNIQIGNFSFSARIKAETVNEGYVFKKPASFCFVVDPSFIVSNNSGMLVEKQRMVLMLRNVTTVSLLFVINDAVTDTQHVNM
jgi:hypothetical protein